MVSEDVVTMDTASLPNWAEALTALASVGTLLAIFFAAVQVRHVNRQMHRELEALYLVRYWQIMDRRSTRFALGGSLTRTDRTVVLDYLALSEDQLGLRAVGRVSTHTWSFWSRDIHRQSSSKHYRSELERANGSSYPRLRRLLVDVDYDPLEIGG